MTYTIYIAQALSILFAIFLAKHDAISVYVFREKGISNIQMAKFHRSNNWTKIVFCFLAALTGFPEWLNMAFTGLLASLWIYLIFDIALNKADNKSWDYIGSNDADGRRWIKWFGDRAGEMKALILLGLIAGVNVVKIFM